MRLVSVNWVTAAYMQLASVKWACCGILAIYSSKLGLASAVVCSSCSQGVGVGVRNLEYPVFYHWVVLNRAARFSLSLPSVFLLYVVNCVVGVWGRWPVLV